MYTVADGGYQVFGDGSGRRYVYVNVEHDTMV